MSSTGLVAPKQMSRENLIKILTGILKYPVSSITGSTGSGKSTIIPAAVASYQGVVKTEKQSGRANQTRTIVAVPTIASALSLSARTRELYSDLKIGHAAENVKAYDDTCDLVFATSGHVYRKYLRKFQTENGKRVVKDIMEFPYIFIDEAHTGTVDNTIISSLWEYMVDTLKLSVFPSLVYMTATEVPGMSNRDEKFIFRSSVDIPSPYHKEILYTSQRLRGIDISKVMAESAATYHHNNPYRHGAPLGKILIFVSGSGQALKIEKMLKDKKLRGAEILTVFSALDDEDRNRVFMKLPPGVRMIIIGTNILESSITIEDVAYIIDGMREKVPVATPTGGIRLNETWISRKSAEQRAGRTGRTMNGVVQRMVTREDFTSTIFKENKTFDITRVPLHEQILEIIAVGLPVTKILKDANTATYKDTMNDLIGLGMVEGFGEDLRVTDRGLFVTKFPLGVRPSAFLYRWLYPPLGRQRYNPVVGIIIASIIDEDPSRIFKQYYDPDPLVITPEKLAIKQEFKTAHSRFAGEDHLVTVLNVWLKFQQETNIDLLEAYPSSEYMNQFFQIRTEITGDWFVVNKIERHIFFEIERIIRRCIPPVRRLGFEVQNVNFDPNEMASYARPMLEKINRDLIMDTTMTPGVFKNKNRRAETMNYYLNDGIIPTTVDLREAESLTAVVVYESGMGASVKHSIRFAVRNNRRLFRDNGFSGIVTVDDLNVDLRLLVIPDVMLPDIFMSDRLLEPEQTFLRPTRTTLSGVRTRRKRVTIKQGTLLQMPSRSIRSESERVLPSNDVKFGSSVIQPHYDIPVTPTAGGKIISIGPYNMTKLRELTEASSTAESQNIRRGTRPRKTNETKIEDDAIPAASSVTEVGEDKAESLEEITTNKPSFNFGQSSSTTRSIFDKPEPIRTVSFGGFQVNPKEIPFPTLSTITPPPMDTPKVSLPQANSIDVRKTLEASQYRPPFAGSIFAQPPTSSTSTSILSQSSSTPSTSSSGSIFSQSPTSTPTSSGSIFSQPATSTPSSSNFSNFSFRPSSPVVKPSTPSGFSSFSFKPTSPAPKPAPAINFSSFTPSSGTGSIFSTPSIFSTSARPNSPSSLVTALHHPK